MAEYALKPRSIFEAVGGARVEGPGFVVDEAPARTLVSFAARRGADPSAAVRKAFALDLPGPARSAEGDGVVAYFDGPGRWFLRGGEGLLDAARKAAAGVATVTDQSDGFASLTLTGPRSRDLLSRLSTLDFADAAFPVGAVARTPMQQISVTILRTGDGPDYVLETPRSTARDLAHDVKAAAKALAAQRMA
ncbi:MAG: hypothetical protein AAGF90_00195 [Pseudomonadota bacterium]